MLTLALPSIITETAVAAGTVAALLAALTAITKLPLIRGPVRALTRALRRRAEDWVSRLATAAITNTLMQRNGGNSVADVAHAVGELRIELNDLTRAVFDHVDSAEQRHNTRSGRLTAIETRLGITKDLTP